MGSTIELHAAMHTDQILVAKSPARVQGPKASRTPSPLSTSALATECWYSAHLQGLFARAQVLAVFTSHYT